MSCLLFWNRRTFAAAIDIHFLFALVGTRRRIELMSPGTRRAALSPRHPLELDSAPRRPATQATAEYRVQSTAEFAMNPVGATRFLDQPTRD